MLRSAYPPGGTRWRTRAQPEQTKSAVTRPSEAPIEKSGVRAALGTPQGSKRHYRVTLEDGQTPSISGAWSYFSTSRTCRGETASGDDAGCAPAPQKPDAPENNPTERISGKTIIRVRP